MRRSEAEGSPNEVSREAVARGRATQVSPNSAHAKHLRSTKLGSGRSTHCKLRSNGLTRTPRREGLLFRWSAIVSVPLEEQKRNLI